MCKHLLSTVVGGTTLFLIASPAAGTTCTFPPDLQRLEYDIHWMGERIGELLITVERSDDSMTVHNRIDVDARIFSHSLFRFSHVSQERWHQGSLLGFQGMTVDNGERRAVQVQPQATTFYVDGKGGPYEVPKTTPLLSAWCRGSFAGPFVIEPTKGRIRSVTLEMLADRSSGVSRQQPSTSRYRVGGDLRADIWYDPRGIVTFARFPVKGGTIGTLELRAP
ncbi:MAG: DUF6134 family protein [Gammaproteobacteria bacterium]